MNYAFIVITLPYNHPLVNIHSPLSSKSFDWGVNVLHLTMKVIDIMRYASTAAVLYPYIGWIYIILRCTYVDWLYLWVYFSHYYSVKGLKLTQQVTSWWSPVPSGLVIHLVGYSICLPMMGMKIFLVFTRWLMAFYPLHIGFGCIWEKLTRVPYESLDFVPILWFRYVAMTVVFLS